MQLKRHSFFEACTNIVVGYTINMIANFLIFPIYGWTITLQQNLTIGVIYTVISLGRSYGLRRAFTHLTENAKCDGSDTRRRRLNPFTSKVAWWDYRLRKLLNW